MAWDGFTLYRDMGIARRSLKQVSVQIAQGTAAARCLIHQDLHSRQA